MKTLQPTLITDEEDNIEHIDDTHSRQHPRRSISGIKNPNDAGNALARHVDMSITNIVDQVNKIQRTNVGWINDMERRLKEEQAEANNKIRE